MYISVRSINRLIYPTNLIFFLKNKGSNTVQPSPQLSLPTNETATDNNDDNDNCDRRSILPGTLLRLKKESKLG